MARFILILCALLFASYASAQTDEKIPSEPAEDALTLETFEVEEKPLTLDTVTAVGLPPIYGDAWAAFQSGDYETAEVEFIRVFDRSRFGQGRSLEAFALARANTATPDSTVLGVPGAQGQDGSLGGSDVRSALNASERGGARRAVVARRQDLGFPLYMAGISQIQLGELEEAKASFYSALKYNRNIHDARLRIGILEAQEGNIDQAHTQFARLERSLKRCRNRCEERDELVEAVAILDQALREAGAVD